MPQRQARAVAKRFEFPPDITVFERLGSIGPRHRCFLRSARSYPGEIHTGPNLTQAPIRNERRPLAQMRRISERLPDGLRRVTQFSYENQRPFGVIIFSYP